MFDFPTKKIFIFSTQSKSNSRLTILKLKNILPHHHSEIEFLRLYCHPVTVIREIFINRKLGKYRIEEGRPPSFTTWIVALESSLSSSRSKWEWHITQNTKNINSEREAWNITKNFNRRLSERKISKMMKIIFLASSVASYTVVTSPSCLVLEESTRNDLKCARYLQGMRF